MIVHESSAKGVKSLKKYKDSSKAKEEKIEISESEQSDNVEDEEDDRASTEESESSISGNEKTTSNANAGWADVMQKILKTNKPKRKKSIVLSKAKKLNEVKHKEISETVPFEVETETGEVKKEIVPKAEKEEDKIETIPTKRKRRDIQLGIRVKPSIKDRERERMLQKIATKGVVQLFNVVKQQQTDIDRKLVEVGPLERKREQVLKSIDKRAFLDVLMGGSKSITVDDSTKSTKVESIEDNKNDKVWSVLRDDFVMGAKLKDWDKKAPEDDNESTSSEEMDSD